MRKEWTAFAVGAAAALLIIPFVPATPPTPPPIEKGGGAESFLLPISPLRDQGDSDLCWVFATLSMLETNYRVRHPGSQVEFSRGALQRHAIADRFRRALAGEPPHLEDGGLGVEAIELIREHGLVAAEDFHDYVDSAPLYERIGQRLATLGDEKARLAAVEAGLDPTPALTHLDGTPLTPQALALEALGDKTWVEYDLAPDGVERIGPSSDPDARADTRVHYAPLATLIELIHASLKRGEAVVWGSVDHAMLIFGADYAPDGQPLAYWVKESSPAGVERMPAEEVHRQLTDVTVTVPLEDAQAPAAQD